jgi:hypothetical protein
MIVDPSAFHDVMRACWAEYGNVYTPTLSHVWLQILATLNYQAGADGSTCWPVIPAELGIGKTTCAKTWCALLPDEVSALVVVRTREQAQEFADDVNGWSGEERAVALFAPDKERDLPNDYWYTPERTKLFRVVVVCHKSYELGLDEFSLATTQARFDIVHHYLDRPRDVTIIDEALDQVAEARIGRGAMTVLMHTLFDRPYHYTSQYRQLPAIRVLESVGRALREAPTRSHAITAAELLAFTDYDVPTATAHLDALWQIVRHDQKIRKEPRAIAGETLAVLRRHLATAPWTDKEAVSSARLLRTPSGTRGVVLDATGQLNNVYLARPDEFDVRVTAPVRSYADVTIFEAPSKDTGKTKVKADAARIAAEVVPALLARYNGQVQERRLLVVTADDKETKDAFRAQLDGAGFAEYDVTNWGKVDGRNQWRTFDTLLIVSLHYGSSTQDINTWLAVQGLAPDDEALSAAEEVRSIKERRIAATIAQAIGRLRLRTMTREDGGCLPCDVFVRLPNYAGIADAEKIMAGVIQTLPGVIRTAWPEATTRLMRAGKTPVIRQNIVDSLLAYGSRMKPGSWAKVTDVRATIGATGHGTWFRTIARPEVKAALAGVGARIEPAIGRRPARLVRDSDGSPVGGALVSARPTTVRA